MSISNGTSLYFSIPYASFAATPTHIFTWEIFLGGPGRPSAGSLSVPWSLCLFASGFLHMVERPRELLEAVRKCIDAS